MQDLRIIDAPAIVPSKEAYTWVAHYADGAIYELAAYAASGTQEGDRKWMQVHASRVIAIELIATSPGYAPVCLAVPRRVTPFLFRRRVMILGPHPTGDPERLVEYAQRGETQTLTVIGWRAWNDGADCYLWVFPDGSVRLSGADDL